MSLPYTAPVPKAADTKEAYGDRPVASGPYKIEDYRRDTSLSLVQPELGPRNRSQPTRVPRPLPDRTERRHGQ